MQGIIIVLIHSFRSYQYLKSHFMSASEANVMCTACYLSLTMSNLPSITNYAFFQDLSIVPCTHSLLNQFMAQLTALISVLCMAYSLTRSGIIGILHDSQPLARSQLHCAWLSVMSFVAWLFCFNFVLVILHANRK